MTTGNKFVLAACPLVPQPWFLANLKTGKCVSGGCVDTCEEHFKIYGELGSDGLLEF